MADAVLSSVVEMLGGLLIQEANSLGGVRGKAEQMQTELKLMRAFLEHADKMRDEDKRVQAYISEIREAAYEAEIVVDTFALKIASRRKGGIGNTVRRCACIFDEAAELHKIGSQIEEFTHKISNLTRSMKTYGIKLITSHEGEASSSVQRQRQSYGHIEEYTVGLETDIKNLVTRLRNTEEESCGVVSICGMGGLGKTTLAKKVFQHNDIRGQFDGFAWACISQQFQRRDVWEGILFKLDSASDNDRDRIKKLRDEEVAEKLYRVLEQKKCLVILDDIWGPEAWNDLLPAFPVRKAPSKVLLTTRYKEVAPSSFPHELRCLNEEESLELLLKKAITAGKHDPADFRNNDMEELGRKMVKRCAGLPLAIVVLGGILATKLTFNEWKIVHENITYNLRGAKGNGQQDSGVLEVLALSYQDLPYQLKPCFLYLGHFPEDYGIPTKELIRKWMAEGIVSSTQHEVVGEETILEDIAQHYLDELMYRNMVQVGELGSTGRVKICRLHDLMRELCLSKANQENFLDILHVKDINKQVDSISSTQNVHRLAVYSSEEPLEVFPEQQRILNLRSLTFFSTRSLGIEILRKVESRFCDFKLLKILDMEQCIIKGNLTSAIGNLIHLRYLNLKFDSGNLPSSIGNLKFLQTLILRHRVGLGIPNVIWKIDKLRHLDLPNYGFEKKKCGGTGRLDNCRDLRTLKGFNSRIFDIKGLAKLTRLKKLQIKVRSLKELVEVQRSSQDTLKCIVSLNIDWFDFDKIESAEVSDLQGVLSGCPNLRKLKLIGQMEKLPEFHTFELTKLTLFGSRLEEDPMPALEKLPNLTILSLLYDSFNGKKMVCSSTGFPRLKSLALVALDDLEGWLVGEEAMPCLYQLTINYCPRLKMVPDGLRFITTLRELNIISMPKEFNDRLRGGGEDSFKVQHVPSILFTAELRKVQMDQGSSTTRMNFEA